MIRILPQPLATTLCAVALACAVTAQAGCLDQSYLPPVLTNGLEVTANQPVTQTFTVGHTGLLTFVEISRLRHHNGISSNPLTIDIVTTDPSGTPTSTVLASTTLPPASIPTTISPVLIDFTAAGVGVVAGQVLGLALTSPNGPGTPSYAWWGEAPGGAYAGGQIFIQQGIPLPVWDLAFQTWVLSPASWANYGAGHPGTNGVPNLFASAPPIIGTTPDLLLGSSLNTPTFGALFLGLAAISIPTPWGGTALVLPVTDVGLFVPTTGALVPFPIPANPAFCGINIYVQGVLLDAGASLGLSFTPGLELIVGA